MLCVYYERVINDPRLISLVYKWYKPVKKC